MKKLIMLLLAVAICAPTSWAQKDLNKTLTQKAKEAQKQIIYDKAPVNVTITYYKQEDYVNPKGAREVQPGTLQVQTTCSALLLNAKGTLAIKKDCLPAINNAAKNNQIVLFVDLKSLGNYDNWEQNVKAEDIGFPLYYRTDNAVRRDFVSKDQFILFALPVRSAAVKTALQQLFANGSEITAEQAAKLLNFMPKAKTVKSLHLY